ncbi:MAG: hypothetical protein WC404_07115 [Candidatus Omnitrophota bacterium]|jgi:hypothetical protein
MKPCDLKANPTHNYLSSTGHPEKPDNLICFHVISYFIRRIVSANRPTNASPKKSTGKPNKTMKRVRSFIIGAAKVTLNPYHSEISIDGSDSL